MIGVALIHVIQIHSSDIDKVENELRVIHLVRTQNFLKTNVSYPLIHTRTCAYQGVRNVSFSENFAYVLNE